jgi:hypothetical protein
VAAELLQQRHNAITHALLLGDESTGVVFKPLQTNRQKLHKTCNRRLKKKTFSRTTFSMRSNKTDLVGRRKDALPVVS